MDLARKMTVDIVLDKDCEVYFTDELVEGYVLLGTTSNLVANFIGIEFIGAGKVRWLDSAPCECFTKTAYSGKEIYHSDQKNFFYGSRLLPARYYKFKFQFPLNRNCLTSYEGDHGYIRYQINFRINRAPMKEFVFRRALTVLNHADININPTYKELRPLVWNTTKCWGITTSRKICLTMRTDKATYVPGQKLKLRLELNNQSKKSIWYYHMKFYTIITYMSKSPFESAHEIKKTIFSWIRNSSGDNEEIVNHKFLIPAIPPTINLSEIVSVKYMLKVGAVVSCAFLSKLRMEMEIHIGTAPLKPQIREEPQTPPTQLLEPAALSTERDLSLEPFEEQQVPSRIDKVLVVTPSKSLPVVPILKIFDRKKSSVHPENEEKDADAPVKKRVSLHSVVQVIEYHENSSENSATVHMKEITELEDIEQMPQPENILNQAEQDDANKIERYSPDIVDSNVGEEVIELQDIAELANPVLPQIKKITSPTVQSSVAKKYNMPLYPHVKIIEHGTDSPDVVQKEEIKQETVETSLSRKPVPQVTECQKNSPKTTPKSLELIVKEIVMEQLDTAKRLPRSENVLALKKQGAIPKRRNIPITPIVEVVSQERPPEIPLLSNVLGKVIEVEPDDNLTQSEEILHHEETTLTQMESVLNQIEDAAAQGRGKRGPTNKRLKRNVCVVDPEEYHRPPVVLSPDCKTKPIGYETTFIKYEPFVDIDDIENDTLYGFRPYYAIYRLD